MKTLMYVLLAAIAALSVAYSWLRDVEEKAQKAEMTWLRATRTPGEATR